MSLLFDSARALTLSPSPIYLFRWGMVLDSFGFYLLYLPIGGYLWATLRRDGGSVVDAAVLFLVAYVILGVLGASIQIVALPLLAELHKSADPAIRSRSEEHTSELQSLMRISYAVFCLKKKKKKKTISRPPDIKQNKNIP